MGQNLIKMSLMMLTVMEPAMSNVVINQDRYKKIGKLTSEISSSFIRYQGLSIIRCLTACKQLDCSLAAWGITDDHQQDCRLLPVSPLLYGDTISADTFSGSLSLYKPIHKENLSILKKTFGYFVHATEWADWQTQFDFCRIYGLYMFTPSNQQNLLDLLKEHGKYWTGTNDHDIEGEFKTGEGIILPETPDLWCPNQPDNGNSGQDCVAVGLYKSSDNGCLNDISCTVRNHKFPAFCYIGK